MKSSLSRPLVRFRFFVNAGMRFCLKEEMCKMRAFTELWDEITTNRYGVKNPSAAGFGMEFK